MHVRMADESVCIGSHQPQNSYLNISSIMSAVDLTGAEAIHTLAMVFCLKTQKFSEIVSKHGIKFIGPNAEIISKMGDKIEAKKIAKNVAYQLWGSEGGVKSLTEAKSICKEIGYPVLIKAAGGGGGKGMKIVNEEEKLEDLFLTAKNEAKKFW